MTTHSDYPSQCPHKDQSTTHRANDHPQWSPISMPSQGPIYHTQGQWTPTADHPSQCPHMDQPTTHRANDYTQLITHLNAFTWTNLSHRAVHVFANLLRALWLTGLFCLFFKLLKHIPVLMWFPNVCVCIEGLCQRPLQCMQLLVTVWVQWKDWSRTVRRTVTTDRRNGCRYELMLVLLGECGNTDELLRQVLSYLVVTVESQWPQGCLRGT